MSKKVEIYLLDVDIDSICYFEYYRGVEPLSEEPELEDLYEMSQVMDIDFSLVMWI